MRAFEDLRAQASDLLGMTLEEINSEISAVRAERKRGNSMTYYVVCSNDGHRKKMDVAPTRLWAEPEKSVLPFSNYSYILYQIFKISLSVISPFRNHSFLYLRWSLLISCKGIGV